MGINIDGARDLVSAGDGSLTIEGFSLNTSGIATITGGVYVGTAASIYSNGNVTAGIVTATEFAVGTAVTIGKTNGNATFSGIVTASSFVGDGAGLTGIGATDNIQTGTPATFLSNINITGVTTATGGIHVGTAATIYANGNATYSGISTFVRVSLTGASESAITTQAATAGGTTTLDMNTSDNWIITMGGNTTIGDPSNEKVGQTGSIWLVQDGTGSRTAAWHSNWKWVGGTAPTLTTTASMIDRVDYIVKAAGEINAVISLDVK